jgi:hypothetical protein
LALLVDGWCNAEAEIVKSPLIQHVVMFGRERNQTGILIELEEGIYDKYNSREGRAKLVEEIWQVSFRAVCTSLDSFEHAPQAIC